MKFVFDRAVKGRKDGHEYFLIEPFKGQGPWKRQGIQFSIAEDWFEHAKKIGRALGITECECGLLPTENDTQFFIFSFKHIKDYMAFTIATCGNLIREFPREIRFTDGVEKVNAIPKIAYFLRQNEIDAQITDKSPNSLMIITQSRFDDFAIAHAALEGHFALSAPDHNIIPLIPRVK
jgi:hypothetical protein